MILLTVGTQLPFDRLVRLVDQIAPQLDEEIFGQIGNGYYIPRNFTFHRTLGPVDFEQKVTASRVIVSHAGIGSLLVAKKCVKPIIFFPRRSALGEHRNDHQLATCSQVQQRVGVYVAYDEDELRTCLRDDNLFPMDDDGHDRSLLALTERIRHFIRSV
jgi:UDP-N-acetylglucosamine transferase subunit ALG13